MKRASQVPGGSESAGRPAGEESRRVFLKRILKGAAAGSLYVVAPVWSDALVEIPEQIPGLRGKDYDQFKQRFAFLVDITRCIGCGSCTVACKREYNVPDHNYRTWVERYLKDIDDVVWVDSPNGGLDGYLKPREDLIRPIRDTFFVPKLCNMCQEPPCVQVCPVGATFRTPDGFILVDDRHCVGCAYCIQACPYSARFLHPVSRTADKCSWCYHRVRRGLFPACVHVCPTRARKFGDLGDPESEVSQILRGPGVIHVLKRDMGTKPSLYYLGLRREVV